VQRFISQKGKSPDCKLKSKKKFKIKEDIKPRTSKCRLRSSHHLKKA